MMTRFECPVCLFYMSNDFMCFVFCYFFLYIKLTYHFMQSLKVLFSDKPAYTVINAETGSGKTLCKLLYTLLCVLMDYNFTTAIFIINAHPHVNNDLQVTFSLFWSYLPDTRRRIMLFLLPLLLSLFQLLFLHTRQFERCNYNIYINTCNNINILHFFF